MQHQTGEVDERPWQQWSFWGDIRPLTKAIDEVAEALKEMSAKCNMCAGPVVVHGTCDRCTQSGYKVERLFEMDPMAQDRL